MSNATLTLLPPPSLSHFTSLQAVFKPFKTEYLNRLQLTVFAVVFFLQIIALLYASHNSDAWRIVLSIGMAIAYMIVLISILPVFCVSKFREIRLKMKTCPKCFYRLCSCVQWLCPADAPRWEIYAFRALHMDGNNTTDDPQESESVVVDSSGSATTQGTINPMKAAAIKKENPGPQIELSVIGRKLGSQDVSSSASNVPESIFISSRAAPFKKKKPDPEIELSLVVGTATVPEPIFSIARAARIESRRTRGTHTEESSTSPPPASLRPSMATHLSAVRGDNDYHSSDY